MIGRDLAFLCLLLALAGCASLQGGDTCAFVRKGEITVRFVSGLPVADVMIDGHPVPMIVDTGGNATVLTDTTVKELGLSYQYNFTHIITGAGDRTAITHPVRVGTIAVGAVTINPGMIAVVPAGSDGVINPLYRVVGGALGLDVLGHYDLDIDMPHQRITLLAPRYCPQGRPPWQGPYAAPTPVEMPVPQGNMPFSVRLDGHPVMAVFDTGDSHTTVSLEAAAAAGVDEAALQHDPVMRISGIHGREAVAHVHRFRELDIGGLRFRNPLLPVEHLPIPGPTMVIGEALFRHTRVYISYASERVFIAP